MKGEEEREGNGGEKGVKYPSRGGGGEGGREVTGEGR